MKGGGKVTNYSPVRHMNHHNHNHHHLRHIDDDADDDDDGNDVGVQLDAELDQELARRDAHLDKDAGQLNLTNRGNIQTGIKTHHRHQQPLPPVDYQAGEEEEQNSSLAEVYLCNCCGVTKELDPAMKYMPVFKSLFFLFNFFVFAFGLANLGMGLWFRIDPKVYEIHKYIETQNFTIAGWILLFGGLLACLTALIGFTATARQAAGLLIFYLLIITTLTLSFVSCIVLLTVYGLGMPLQRFLTKEIYEQIRRRTMNTEVDLFVNNDAAQFLDFVQVKKLPSLTCRHQMRCCGAANYLDYQKLGMALPTTCYTIAGNVVNAPGCGRAIRELFDIRAGLATGFATGSAITQLLTIILSVLMVCSIYNWRANPQPASTGLNRTQATLSSSTPLQLYHQRPPSRSSSIAV